MTSHFIRDIYANEIEIKVNHINVVIKMAFKTAYEQYTDHNSAADMIEIYIVYSSLAEITILFFS